jgi:hypothetical protein
MIAVFISIGFCIVLFAILAIPLIKRIEYFGDKLLNLEFPREPIPACLD